MGLLHTQRGLCPNTHLPSPRSRVSGSRISGGTEAWSARSRMDMRPEGGKPPWLPSPLSPVNHLGKQGPQRPGPGVPLPAEEKEARPHQQLTQAQPDHGDATPSQGPFSLHTLIMSHWVLSKVFTLLQTTETGSAGPGHPQSLPAGGPHSPGGCSFQNMWHSPLCYLTLSAQPTFVSPRLTWT